jgi:cyclopropane-fatty-acyl-phospholipid synthase
MSLRRFLLSRIRAANAQDPLPLRIVFWDGETFDLGADPSVTLNVRSPAVARALVMGRMSRLEDHYVAGSLGVDGSVEDVLRIGIALSERLARSSTVASLGRLARWIPFAHSRRNDAAAVRAHYDVSNEFYRLWLDSSMTYSCAYFPTGTEDIDQAQQHKIDHICRKLRLGRRDHVLDIGCGWGGLLRQVAARYGATGVGVTNSPAQYGYACERAAASGLDGRIEFRLQDYRDIPGSAAFDRIVSVGMYEHVGLRNLPIYFAAVARLLRPGGALLNQGIVTTDPEGRVHGPAGSAFISRYVFPGGELPNMPYVLSRIACCGLETVDVEDLRPHYARTLRIWTERFEAKRDEVIAVAGEERYRVWRVYLAGMAHAFERGWLSVAHVLAYKPVSGRAASRPWSRAYQYAPSRETLA